MNYKLTYTARTERDIKKLDTAIKNRIGKALLKLQTNPLLYLSNSTIHQLEHTDSV